MGEVYLTYMRKPPYGETPLCITISASSEEYPNLIEQDRKHRKQHQFPKSSTMISRDVILTNDNPFKVIDNMEQEINRKIRISSDENSSVSFINYTGETENTEGYQEHNFTLNRVIFGAYQDFLEENLQKAQEEQGR